MADAIRGALTAAAGFVVVGRHTGGDVTAAGFACLLIAAYFYQRFSAALSVEEEGAPKEEEGGAVKEEGQ